MGLIFASRNEFDTSVASFTGPPSQTEFPALNIFERALSVKYKSASATNRVDQFNIIFDAVRTIQIVALLDHNYPSDAEVTIELLNDSSQVILSDDIAMTFTANSDSNFPNNTFIIFDSAQAGVLQVNVSIERVPSADYEVAPFLGRLWGGAIWQPTSDGAATELSTFSQAIIDNSSPQSSRGNSWKSDNLRRVRVNSISIPAMTETEAIGNSSGAVNLQDILFEVGSSQECIIIPSTANSQVIHKFGLYGHLTGESRISLVDKSGGTRVYRTDLTHLEEN